MFKIRLFIYANIVVIALTACGAAAASPSAAKSATAPQQALLASSPLALASNASASKPLTTTAGVSTTLVPLTLHTDTLQNFVIGYPQSWKQDQSVVQGARFTYKTYVLTLAFADAKGATAASFTKTEVATEQSKGSTNIKLTLTGQADRFRNIIAQTAANSLKLAR